MFSLNMLDYPMSFLSLSTWTWNTFPTLRGTWAFYLNHVLPPRPSKSYRLVAHEILVSAQGPLVLVLRLRVWGQGLTIIWIIWEQYNLQRAGKKSFDLLLL